MVEHLRVATRPPLPNLQEVLLMKRETGIKTPLKLWMRRKLEELSTQGNDSRVQDK